jgi:hypothetical protein
VDRNEETKLPAMTEVLSGGADSLKGVGTGVVGMVGGLAAALSLHESIDTDEQAIVLSRGRVRLDRKKTKEELGTSRVRKARRILTEQAVALDEPPRKYLAEYAKIHDAGGKFKFFSLRSIRKMKTNDQNSGLPKQRLVLGNEETWEFDSNITWAVEPKGQNVARALLNASSQEEVTQRVVTSTAKAALEGIVSLAHENERQERSGNIFSSSAIFKKILEISAEPLQSNYGVTLLDYELVSYGTTESQTGVNGWGKIFDRHFPGPGGMGEIIERAAPLHVVSGE